MKCKNCGSEEFIRNFEGYDILTFDEDGNEVPQGHEITEDDNIRCRECEQLVNYDDLNEYEKLVSETVRFWYNGKSTKGHVKEVNEKFIILETTKEYFIPIKEITSKQVCK